MDFNTGSDPERPESTPPDPGSGPRRTSGRATGSEFNYSDPVQSFVETVRNLVTRPVGFFAGISRQGDFVNPLIFALICLEIAAIIGGLLAVLGAIVGIGGQSPGEAIGAFVGSVLLTPILGAIGLFIGAGILHLLVILIIRPVSSGFETTFRVVSYSAVAQLVSWIPILGPIIAGIASIVLGILGIRETHSTTTLKAAIVVLIPSVVVLLLVLILIVFVSAALFFGAQQ